MDSYSRLLEYCQLCPRECGVNRRAGEKGFCRGGVWPRVGRAGLHYGEEPCLSGSRGSGVVFFSGCNLRCVFCQNHIISQGLKGRNLSLEELGDIFIRLQEKGAHNLNLITAFAYVPQVLESLSIARRRGFNLPVVYNTSGYEKVETLKLLEGQVSVYLPDIKYYRDHPGLRYSSVTDYFRWAGPAVKEMYRQVGPAVFDEQGIMIRGVIIRILLLPGFLEDAREILNWISRELPEGVWISLMSQYTPTYQAHRFPEICRPVSSEEYELLLEHFLALGLENAFIQELSSAKKRFIPAF